MTSFPVYVEASNACNDLLFHIGDHGIGAEISTRQWSIKVTHLECTHPLLAPNGCTQYYFGANTGSVKTFNYDAGIHLAEQNQNICFRRERGFCRLCFSVAQAGDFEVTGKQI